MAEQFDIDFTNSEMVDALADAGTAASGWGPLGDESTIAHIGSPELFSIDLTSVDISATVASCAEHATSWKERVAPTSGKHHRALVNLPEVTPASIELASGLRGATAVGSVMVHDDIIAGRLPWQWPLKVGWMPGTVGEGIANEVAVRPIHSWMHTLVQFAEHGTDAMPGLVDLMIVPEHADPHPLLSSRGVRANALILADEKAPATERLDQARGIAEHLGAGAILMPCLTALSELVEWLTRLVEEISHKNPLDVAMGKSTTAGIVIGNDQALAAPLQDVTHRMAARAREVMYPGHEPAPSFGIDDGSGFPALPQSLEILEVPDDDFESFAFEGTGATTVQEFREWNELGVDLLPDAPAQRMLKAGIFCDGISVEHAVAGGKEHWIHLWIGNGASGFLNAETPSGAPAIIDPNDLRPDIPADIVIWGDGIDMQVQMVMVSPLLLSELASFPFKVAKRAKEFTINVALLVDGRVVQSGVVKGPVTPGGGKPRRENAPEMRFVVGPNLVDLDALDTMTHQNTVTIMEHDAGAHSIFEAGIDSIRMQSLANHFDQSLALLVEAQVDSKQDTWLRSKSGAESFAKLARQGADAFQAIVGDWETAEPDRLAAMIATEDVHVAMFGIDESQLAVELLYDREVPTTGADWCAGFDVALQTGMCPTCVPYDPRSGGTDENIAVCPAGFWGVRKIIERSTVPVDEQGFPIVLQNRTRIATDPIESLNRVLIGTSDRVDKAKIDNRKPSSVMLDLINNTVDQAPVIVTDWPGWRGKVKDDQPQVLVLLTHTTADALELGTSSRLDRLLIKTFYVREPYNTGPAGPIVLLLGCDTASTGASLTSFAAKFLQRGASVVVATNGSTLGRFAAPIAGELVAAMADPNGPPTMGEALRDVRRSTLQKGWVTGLLVTSFGAADYTFTRN